MRMFAHTQHIYIMYMCIHALLDACTKNALLDACTKKEKKSTRHTFMYTKLHTHPDAFVYTLKPSSYWYACIHKKIHIKREKNLEFMYIIYAYGNIDLFVT